MTEMKFFFFGSFSEGSVHFHKIKDFIVSSAPASIRGSAYQLKVGFPVLLEAGNDLIQGAVVTLNASQLLVQLLHQFHGFNQIEPEKSLYFFREVSVQTSEGETLANTYFLNPKKLPKTARLIEGGDWSALINNENFLEKLTERQRTYICKLGEATGREIVPIQDLSLYRELMNLELIVDKGRRLALSKLGHEVYRYLV